MLSVDLIYVFIPNLLVLWIIGMNCFLPFFFFCQGEGFELVKVFMELVISVFDGNR